MVWRPDTHIYSFPLVLYVQMFRMKALSDALPIRSTRENADTAQSKHVHIQMVDGFFRIR